MTNNPLPPYPITKHCRTCGAKPGEPCRPTGSLTSTDEAWVEYRKEYPHPSRDWGEA